MSGSLPLRVRHVLALRRSQGWSGMAAMAWRRLRRRPAGIYYEAAKVLAGLRGLEVGGPTPLFGPGRLMPVYPLIEALDNCNFAGRTLWEGTLEEGQPFHFRPDRPPGRQILREAGDLRGVEDERYDFVLSSHTLEHLANPLGALAEWRRVVRVRGHLMMVLPHKAASFDRRRPVTTLEHLEQDARRRMAEDDLTHLSEVLEFHDLSLDPGADPATFRQRCRDNARVRALHHHVFDGRLAARVVDAAGWKILAAELARPFHILILAEKPEARAVVDNTAWLAADAPWLTHGPWR